MNVYEIFPIYHITRCRISCPNIPLYSQKQPFWALVSLLSFWTSTSCPPRRRFHRVWMDISPEVVTCYRRCGTFISMAGSLNASSWDDGYSDPQEGKGRLGKWRIMLKAHQKNENPFVNIKNLIYVLFIRSHLVQSINKNWYLFLFVKFFLRVLLKEQAFNIKTILGDREFVETYAPLEHWFSFQWEQIWSMAENRLRPASWGWTFCYPAKCQCWTGCVFVDNLAVFVAAVVISFSRILLLHGSFYGS